MMFGATSGSWLDSLESMLATGIKTITNPGEIISGIGSFVYDHPFTCGAASLLTLGACSIAAYKKGYLSNIKVPGLRPFEGDMSSSFAMNNTLTGSMTLNFNWGKYRPALPPRPASAADDPKEEKKAKLK